jgi:hypothetical protein
MNMQEELLEIQANSTSPQDMAKKLENRPDLQQEMVQLSIVMLLDKNQKLEDRITLCEENIVKLTNLIADS